MAELELVELQNKHEVNEKKLKLFLLPKDEADKKDAIIEIRAKIKNIFLMKKIDQI